MDDKQLAMLLTAMSDQTVAMNRMADAMTGILLHLDPKQAAKFAAPGYMRPLLAYATFDWNSIDAHVIAFDRSGATEVEHNGVAYRRYRSNDDDPKGIDIRFRRVVSGTPEGKDMIWATLIKFADKKAKDAPRPLRGELAAAIEGAQQKVIEGKATTVDHVQALAGPTEILKPSPSVLESEADAAKRLGGQVRSVHQIQLEKLNGYLARIDRITSKTKANERKIQLGELKAGINTEATLLGLHGFEGKSGQSLDDAQAQLRGVLAGCIKVVEVKVNAQKEPA